MRCSAMLRGRTGPVAAGARRGRWGAPHATRRRTL